MLRSRRKASGFRGGTLKIWRGGKKRSRQRNCPQTGRSRTCLYTIKFHVRALDTAVRGELTCREVSFRFVCDVGFASGCLIRTNRVRRVSHPLVCSRRNRIDGLQSNYVQPMGEKNTRGVNCLASFGRNERGCHYSLRRADRTQRSQNRKTHCYVGFGEHEQADATRRPDGKKLECRRLGGVLNKI